MLQTLKMQFKTGFSHLFAKNFFVGQPWWPTGSYASFKIYPRSAPGCLHQNFGTRDTLSAINQTIKDKICFGIAGTSFKQYNTNRLTFFNYVNFENDTELLSEF